MSQRDDLDFTTLNWVKRELDETLKQARQALEAFVENPTDPTQMRFCASYLHQVQGTLRMVELYGAAQVSEEMERLAQAIVDGKAKPGEETYTALMRGIVQLPDYLERLQGGHKDIPIVLLPLLNDLRSARGEGLLSETALFSPNLYVDLPAQAAGAATPLPDGEVKLQAARLRGAFQTSLVRWYRDDEPEAMVARLFAVLERLRSICHVTEARRLWWIAAVVADGIKQNAIGVNLSVKLLFGKIDREIKHLVESGEPSFRAAPPNDLIKNLLYYIAHAAPDTARTKLVRSTYGLSTLIPDEAELEHAKGSLAGRNRALLDTVGGAIKEDLLRVKEGLDLHLRSASPNSDALKPLVQQLAQIGDTLGMLGLGVPRKVVQEQKEILDRMTYSSERSDENALLDVAGALLYVEASLDDHIHTLGGAAPVDESIDPTTTIPQAEMRKIMDQTMREAATNLQLAKENIVAFIESPWDHDRLNDTPRLLDEVVGALRVMQHTEAGKLLDGVKRFIHVELVEKQQVPNARQLDTLADALVSIEYYLEALKEQRPGREKGLEVARRSLRELGYWSDPVDSGAEAIVAVDVFIAEADSAESALIAAAIEPALPELPAYESESAFVEPIVVESEHVLAEPPAFAIDSDAAASDQAVESVSDATEPMFDLFEMETEVEAPAPESNFADSADGFDFLFDELPALEAGFQEELPPSPIEFDLDLPADFEASVSALAQLDAPASAADEFDFSFEPEPSADAVIQVAPIGLDEIDFAALEATVDGDRAAPIPIADGDFDFSFDDLHPSEAERINVETEAAMAPATSLDDFIKRFELNAATAEEQAFAAEIEPSVEEFTAVEIAEGDGLEALIIGDSADEPSTLVPQNLDGLRVGQFDLTDAEPEPTLSDLAARITAPPQPLQTRAPSGFEVVLSDDIDEEIREVFVEEVAEVLDAMASAYPQWLADTANFDRLTPIRRAYHTMKGSGRLVGAMALGEFSWKIENMLNRVLDKTIPVNANVFEVMDESMLALPQFLAALRGEGSPSADIGAIMHVAERLSNGEQISLKALLFDNQAQAQALAEIEEPESAILQASDLDQPPPLWAVDEAETEQSVDVDAAAEAPALEEVDVFAFDFADSAETGSNLEPGPLADAAPTLEEPVLFIEAEELLLTAELPEAEPIAALQPDFALADFDLGSDFAEFESGLQASTAETLNQAKTLDQIDQGDILALPDFESADAALGLDELPDVSLAELEAAFASGEMSTDFGLLEPTAQAFDEASGDVLEMSSEISFDALEEPDFAALDALGSAYAERTPAQESEELNIASALVDAEAVASGMDPVLLEILKTEVSAHLGVIRDYLSGCRTGQTAPVATESLMRAVHTLNGAISMVDVPLISSVMGPLEGYVKRLRQKDEGPNAEGVAAIGDVVAMVELVVAELESPHPNYPPDDHLPERLTALRDALPPVDVQAQLTDLAFEDDDELVLTSISDDVEELSEDQKAAFADELAALDAFTDPLVEELAELPPEFDALAALEATIADLKSQEASIDSSELEADDVSATGSILADADFSSLPDFVDAFADFTPDLEEEILATPIALSDGGETRFKLDFERDPDAALDMGDIDSDLLDIFLEEGNEILDASDGFMVRLREKSDDREQISALQRELHTLKGGARMAGLNTVGDLSHSMESLFESISEGRNSVSRQTVEVLESAFDRLHAMMARIAKRQAVSQPDSAVAQLEALTRGETLKAPEPEETLLPFTQAPAADEAAEAQTAGSSDALAANLPAAKPGAAAVKFVAPKRRVELKPTKADEDEAAGVRATQEVVRVRSDLLDNLVNYAGEVSIYRSRLEQQVGSFRTNLVELDSTVSRLREQLRKLEMETEAQILSRYQREMEDADKDFDPLELDRFSNLQQLSRALAESVSDLSSLQNLLDDVTRQSETLLLQQSRVSSELQEGLMRTRMVPFDSLVPRLRRILRQTAQELDKRAQLRVLGAQGEMDRNVLERMTAPLEHMLRNAIAHGLETPAERAQFGKSEEGTVTIAVSREATEVVLRVSDDGRGLDREAIRRKAIERGLLRPEVNLSDRDLFQFILETGFSTAEVVSKVAGRGVGMDVVGSEIKQLGGSLQIDSTRGKGTIFTVRLPFTLAVTHAIMVRLGEVVYALPLSAVQGVVRVPKADFEKRLAEANPMYTYAGEDYTLQELRTVLGLDIANLADDGQLPVVLVRTGDQRAAVRVDSVLGSREIVVKSVGPQISSVPGIFGATILGDGSVVVILDLAPLLRRSMAVKETRVVSFNEDGLEIETMVPVAPAQPVRKIIEDRQPLVMVVDDSITMRKVTTRVLERQDYDVLTAKDGLDAITVMTERVPDLMLLDIEMPRMDGFELAIHMRNDPRLRGVPIIMITSRTGEKHRQRARELGVNRYLGKPYQEQELLANVKDALKEANVIER